MARHAQPRQRFAFIAVLMSMAMAGGCSEELSEDEARVRSPEPAGSPEPVGKTVDRKEGEPVVGVRSPAPVASEGDRGEAMPAAAARSLESMGAKVDRKESGTVIDIRNSPRFTDAAVDLVLKESNVVDLTMQNVPLTDAGLAKLGPLDKLGRLILNDSKVTGEGVRELTKMPLKDTLWNISVRNTTFGDGDVAVLGEFPRLVRVDLSGTQVTDAGLERLPDHRFRMINVTGTAVTDDGAETFAKRFPGVDLIR